MTKKLLSLSLLAILACGSSFASSKRIATDAFAVTAADIARADDNLFVKIDLDLTGYKDLESNREVLIRPMLVAGSDTLALPDLAVAGHARYYYWLRKSEKSWPVQSLYRASRTAAVDYTATVPYQSWMDESQIIFTAETRGCCGTPHDLADVPLVSIDFRERKFTPEFLYIEPTAEVKTRELSGRAFIDFPVNRTEIYPDYRSNLTELLRIGATIDSVRLDPDVTVRSITLKGFASPEGPYDNNVRLAKGRTEALRTYIERLYTFNKDTYHTAYEPEDWGGLRRWLLDNEIANRDAILAIVDSNLEPDPKNTKIQTTFPTQYAFLLREVYPALRHTDYTIEYTIRSYNDPAEILRVMQTRPQNLSLNEFFLAAKTLKPGTPEYGQLFETAARIYPDSEVANLNAANVAMQAGALDNAAAYLSKAGDGDYAVYARGLLAGLRGDYNAALDYLRQAARFRVAQAPAAIEQLQTVIEKNNRNQQIIINNNNQ